MISSLPSLGHLPDPYDAFLKELAERGFSGEIRSDYASRLSAATDNSVYQLVPQAVVFPRAEPDVVLLLTLLADTRYRAVRISPRGGGTGTNGQSLSDGIMVDLSRHLGAILDLDLGKGVVVVQPGVILDQLNAFLAPHGVMFAPTLSPSSRATLGGMIATDACGKGSRIYGKTSQHVEGMRCVVLGGEVIETKALGAAELERERARPDATGRIYREVTAILERSRDRFASELPKLKRFLTGYDLAHVVSERGFDLGRIISGSEGTLGIVTQASLRLTPIVRRKQLFAIRYRAFDDALRAASWLVEANPGAIETIDDTIVGLAKKDVIWGSVAHVLRGPGEPELRAVNLVEFEADDQTVLDEQVSRMRARLEGEIGQPGALIGYELVTKPADIKALWTLRKKGVGLLGNAPGNRRPVPFVEDTVVPPEHLADYIREFRAILDGYGLRYGMFGHVDVGCLHVRPALDLKDEEDERTLRAISDAVAALVKKYGGVLWGEHGRGYRSEYTPTFFGPELYREMRAIKTAFDPDNQLNPGKLAAPARRQDRLVSVDAMKRGAFDRQIEPQTREKYATAVNCNGNGQCFDWNPDSVMCPSSKVTRDRIHSPKGRAGILREWLRLVSRSRAGLAPEGGEPGVEIFRGRAADPADFSHEVYDAMNGCLACKACATECPIHVDVPALRADFLEQYHGRYRRPLKDYFVAWLERMLVVLALVPRLSNWLMNLAPSRRLLEWVGLVDTPPLAAHTLAQMLGERGAPRLDLAEIASLSGEERARTVIIVQDAFTTYYEPNVAFAAYELLHKLGRRVFFLPMFENGKALHVKGFVSWFARRVRKNAEILRQVAGLGVPLVGIEPATTLTYRDEYPHALGGDAGFEVALLQEYLTRELPSMRSELGERFPRLSQAPAPGWVLFGHCTEKTAQPRSQELWRQLFTELGGKLETESLGCCGMCGVYGHEREHLAESRGIFELSWQPHLPSGAAESGRVLCTGHSCRSQLKRFAALHARHPAEVLAAGLA